MNRFEFNARKEKFLKHSDDYGEGYYYKIPNYYGTGPNSTRYFYSKEEYDAYLENQNKLLENAKEEVRKQNLARTNKKQNEDYANNAGAARAAKEKENAEKYAKMTKEEYDINMTKDTKEKLSKTLAASKYNDAVDIILNSKEVQQYINGIKEKLKGIETQEDINKVYNINKSFNDIYNAYSEYADILSKDTNMPEWIPNAIAESINESILKEAEGILNVYKLQNEQYEREQNAIYQNALATKNYEVVYSVVTAKINDYYNNPNPTTADKEMLDQYLSDLRSCESSISTGSKIIDNLAKGLELLSLKGTTMTPEEDMKYINYRRNLNDNYEDGDGNCVLCTLAMDLRQRGFDVTAANANDFTKEEQDQYSGFNYHEGKVENRGFFSMGEYNERLVDKDNDGRGIFELYQNAEKADVYDFRPKETAESIINAMSKYPNTSGQMWITWKGGGAHAVYYQISDSGVMTIYDGQANKSQILDQKYMNNVLDGYFVRTDNLLPNFDNITKKGYVIYN